MAWNASDNRKPIRVVGKANTKSTNWFRVTLWGCIALVLVLTLVWFVHPAERPVIEQTEKMPGKANRISSRTNRVDRAHPVAPTNNLVRPKHQTEVETYLGQKVVSHSFKTNSTGRSVREIIVTADGQRHGRTTVIAKPTFHYSTDQMLADVLFPPKHGSLPPLPAMDGQSLDREFAQSILDPIKINDDDPEEVRLKKLAVSEARHEVVKLLKEGYSVLEIIERERAANEDAHEMQLEVRKALFQLRKEGATQAELRDFLSRANETLEKGGIAPVPESATQKTRH